MSTVSSHTRYGPLWLVIPIYILVVVMPMQDAIKKYQYESTMNRMRNLLTSVILGVAAVMLIIGWEEDNAYHFLGHTSAVDHKYSMALAIVPLLTLAYIALMACSYIGEFVHRLAVSTMLTGTVVSLMFTIQKVINGKDSPISYMLCAIIGLLPLFLVITMKKIYDIMVEKKRTGWIEALQGMDTLFGLSSVLIISLCLGAYNDGDISYGSFGLSFIAPLAFSVVYIVINIVAIGRMTRCINMYSACGYNALLGGIVAAVSVMMLVSTQTSSAFGRVKNGIVIPGAILWTIMLTFNLYNLRNDKPIISLGDK